MNLDSSKSIGNGCPVGCSITSNSKVNLANGGSSDRSSNNTSNDVSFPSKGISSLRLPVVTSHETSLLARCRRVYAHAHDYHINLISNNRFEEYEAPCSRSFFTEIIASISDIKFAKGRRYILNRDYMTLKLWDINMDSGLVSTFQVHKHLRPKLCDLYENDSIFDKFECCLSGYGSRVATGSYRSNYVGGQQEPHETPSRPSRSLSSITRVVRRGSESPRVDANGNSFDFTTKLLHLAWHPSENSIACAASNSLYMYNA